MKLRNNFIFVGIHNKDRKKITSVAQVFVNVELSRLKQYFIGIQTQVMIDFHEQDHIIEGGKQVKLQTTKKLGK